MDVCVVLILHVASGSLRPPHLQLLLIVTLIVLKALGLHRIRQNRDRIGQRQRVELLLVVTDIVSLVLVPGLIQIRQNGYRARYRKHIVDFVLFSRRPEELSSLRLIPIFMHHNIGTVINLTITVVHSRFFVSLVVHGVDKLRGDSVEQEHLKEMIPSEVLRQMVAELLPSALEAN